MTTLKIFLASSEELKPERLVIAELVTTMNYAWAEHDVSIRLVKWEYLDSSMGAQHKQEDYNDHLRQCDMCIVLYWTKFGMYTEIELETAYRLYNSDGGMSQMSVFFKDGGEMTDGLKAFRQRYEAEHPELCQSFDSEASLKELFCQQIVSCLERKNEEEHSNLAKKVKRAEKLLAMTEEDEPEYEEYKSNLKSAKVALEHNENFMTKIIKSIQN